MKRAIFPTVALLSIVLVWLTVQEQNGSLIAPFPTSFGVESTNDPGLIAFSHPSGVYDYSFSLRVIAGCQSPTIAITTDGSEPKLPNPVQLATLRQVDVVSAESTLHLNINQPALTIVKAKAVCPDTAPTDTINAAYVLDIPHSIPIVSIAVDPPALNDPETGLLNNVQGRGRDWERHATVTLFDGNSVLDFDSGLRLHGSTSRTSAKKSWRLYFRSEYGMSRLNYPLLGENVFPQSYKRLVLSSGSQDWTLLRTQIINQLADELNIPTTNARPIHLFVNGEPQGLYLARNYLNDHFYSGKYGYEVVEQIDPSREEYAIHAPNGVDSVDALSPELQAQWALNDWETVRAFLDTHDLSDDANLAHIGQQVNLPQLIDYHILQMYIANKDWIRNNYDMIRPLEMADGSPVDSRWQYIVWDVDFGLGVVPESFGSVEDDMFSWVYSDIDPKFDRGAQLILALFENDAFRSRYLLRLDELLETTLSSRNVNRYIDKAVSELEADIAVEMLRWGSRGHWAQNVAALYAYTEQRPGLMRQHAEAWHTSQGDR